MASRFVSKSDPHFDSTTVTIECDRVNGEIEGVHAIKYGDKTTKGSVKILGSRVEVGWTPGEYTADEASITMHRSKVSALLQSIQSAGTGAVSDVLCTFTITYAFLDEEGNPEPSQTDVFTGFVLGRSDNIDRGSTDPLMEELPIKIQGQIKWHGGVKF
jgi:hypothetical protein